VPHVSKNGEGIVSYYCIIDFYGHIFMMPQTQILKTYLANLHFIQRCHFGSNLQLKTVFSRGDFGGGAAEISPQHPRNVRKKSKITLITLN